MGGSYGFAAPRRDCEDSNVTGCAPWSSHANTSTCRWGSGRCGPSSPRPPRPARIPASSSTPTSSSSRSPSLRWAVRLAGYGFVVAVPEIYHRIEPAGTVLGFDDEGKARGQADAEATPTAGLRRGRRGRAGLARTSAARTSAPRATARAGTSRSGRRSTRACARRCAGTRPACTTASSARSKTDSLERAGRHRRRHPADLRHQGPAHAAAGARDHPRRARGGRDALHLERVRGRARLRARRRATASTPRRPTARSPRRRRSCAASCDPLRPSRLGELPEGRGSCCGSSGWSTSGSRSTSSAARGGGRSTSRATRTGACRCSRWTRAS